MKLETICCSYLNVGKWFLFDTVSLQTQRLTRMCPVLFQPMWETRVKVNSQLTYYFAVCLLSCCLKYNCWHLSFTFVTEKSFLQGMQDSPHLISQNGNCCFLDDIGITAEGVIWMLICWLDQSDSCLWHNVSLQTQMLKRTDQYMMCKRRAKVNFTVLCMVVKL